MTLCSKYPPSIIYTLLSALKSRVHGLKALYKEDFVPFRIPPSSNRNENNDNIYSLNKWELPVDCENCADFNKYQENKRRYIHNFLDSDDLLQIYGYNSDLYQNISEAIALQKNQGLVGISILLQTGDLSNSELRIITSQLHKIVHRGESQPNASVFSPSYAKTMVSLFTKTNYINMIT
ncbi:hypothetical protein AVEN_115075-2 [Araneus ventricosus]|uniref:Uncharacterized protein n=1 Tax=Araneus ventricosus TaxID=182803 RepID=A0A4Y1ZY62_ARAVE|nr:hypothetical protein AVEN_115075-2 [Araneus ventricosus]